MDCKIFLLYLVAPLVLWALMILLANILLRYLTSGFNRQWLVPASEHMQFYTVRIICQAQNELQVRNLMLHSFGDTGLQLLSLHSENLASPAKIELKAEVSGNPELTGQLENLISRVNLENGVSSIRWQLYNIRRD